MQQIFDRISSVYNSLCDAESKMIFRERLMFNLTGDYCYFFALLKQSEERSKNYYYISDFLSMDLDLDRPVVFWGIKDGWIFEISKLLEVKGIVPSVVCDSDQSNWGKKICAMEVVSPNELYRKYPNAYILIANPFPMEEHEIYKEAIRTGYQKSSIFKILSWKGPEYFTEFMPLKQNGGVFVDAGCFDGYNSIEYLNVSGDKNCKIYAFEPSKRNYDICYQNIKEKRLEKTVNLFQKGLWSKAETLHFSYSADGSSISEQGEEVIEVVALDDVINEEYVDFIKMDIEGSELEALKGARKTIERCRPYMAICIYHKPEDIIELPLYIKEILPDCRFYIRHKNVYLYDTILYVIP